MQETSTNVDPLFRFKRVKAKFDTQKFIADCRVNPVLAEEIIGKPTNKREEIERILASSFKLKDCYKANDDNENYTFTYQSMAKLLLATDKFPSEVDGKQFLKRLIDKIGFKILSGSHKEKN